MPHRRTQQIHVDRAAPLQLAKVRNHRPMGGFGQMRAVQELGECGVLRELAGSRGA